MPFTFQLPTYQVETQTSFTLYPSRAEADNDYQKNVENNKNNWVPFDHPEMDKWRDSLHHGLKYEYKNILLTGGVDDIWQDTVTNELILVDYKSQANEEIVSEDTYFKGEYKIGYQRQLDFYVYLLKQQNLNIEISDYAYLYVVNTRGLDEKFDNKLLFEATLIPA